MDKDKASSLSISPVAAQHSPSDPRAEALRQFASKSGDASVFNQLLDNPFFTAGFGLAGLGAALRYGSQGLRKAGSLLRQCMLVDLEITRHDESYRWVLNWMTRHYQSQLSHDGSQKQIGIFESLVRRLTPGLHHLQMKTSTLKTASGSARISFSLEPGHGRHILRYRNAFIAVNRERLGKSFDQSGQPFETVKLTTLYHFRHIFEEMFQEAYEMAAHRQEDKTVIYTYQDQQWKESGQPKRRRPFDSVVLEEGLSERILNDIHEFLNSRVWYLDRGIPYRRGYLLYGPPGTGKTSFVQALAGKLDFNIAMLSLSLRGLHDDMLNKLLNTIPPRTLVLLEDADAAFSNRRQVDADGYSGAHVTYSGLLNALDGVASAEERIIFMTTNHLDRLDDALIRPGRVDMTVHLGNASSWQIGKLWDRFYAEQDPDGQGRQRFLRRTAELGLEGNISTAALQGLFLYSKDDVEGAIRMIDQLSAYKSGGAGSNHATLVSKQPAS